MKLKYLIERRRLAHLRHAAQLIPAGACHSRMLDAFRRCGCSMCTEELIPRCEQQMVLRRTPYHATCVGLDTAVAVSSQRPN